MADRTNSFFTWVWRINGLLILAIALVSLVSMIAFVVNVGLFASRESPAEGIAEVAGTHLEDSDLNFGTFRSIKGTDVLYATLGTPSEYIGSGSIRGVANVRNLLFFDTTKKKAHWLLGDNATQVYRSQFLSDPPDCSGGSGDEDSCEANRKAVAILLDLGPPRSEKSRATGSRNILIASPDGRDLKPLVENVDAILGVETPSKNSVFVFYTMGGSVRFAQIDPSARLLVSDEALQVSE